MAPASVRVGCSGWEYPHWRGDFYPRDLARDRWLEFYAEQFDTVELNNSFYRLPAADAFESWRRRLPPGFVMAVKASRYLTHMRKLKDPEEPLDRLWSRARRLRERLGPVLYQLPPRWKPNVDRLAAFLVALPRHEQAIEFRNRDWYPSDLLALLDRHHVALCLHDMPGSSSDGQPVGPFAYLRFHGTGEPYGGAYPPQRLTAWADRLARWASDGRRAYVYFNNDLAGHAVRDALRLRELLDRRGIGA
jgi:uncharacterized protein YecE (DUF72 family)